MKNLKIIKKEALFVNLAKFEGKKVCAMVKSNAYGHGLKEIVELIEDKVEYFGVVSIEEGVALRKLTQKPILICSKVSDFGKCKKHQLDVIVEDEEQLKQCHRIGLCDVHLKINCGMNRYGTSSELALRAIDEFLQLNNIKLKSICTHFPRTEDKNFTLKCYQKFQHLANKISQDVELCFGGSGIWKYDLPCDIIRLGIGMYGYEEKDLEPVMQIKSFVNKVFYAKKGEFVGYGDKFWVKNSGYFAVVPVGYGDGLHRSLSGKFKVKINGKAYPCVGNICMDAFFVQVDQSVAAGDEVVVLEDAAYLAEKAGTISYEMLTSFSNFRGKTVIV
ncbi:MAG: alanine racemase [Clostridia bacterium]|nr:alanine racemase [Clostridia bacterium]